MPRNNILFVGFGDLAYHISEHLPEHRCVGICRSRKTAPAHMSLWLGAVQSSEILRAVAREPWQAVVITLTPEEMSDAGYRRGYVETLQALLPVLQASDSQPCVVMASSTSVYGQVDGSWVDETSATEPESFAGGRLLESEALLRHSGLAHTILRLAGLYGPGRDFLLRQVKAGKGGSDAFTNRIHIADAAAAFRFVLARHFQGATPEHLYLACDNEPAPAKEVRQWLAEQIGIDPAGLVPTQSSRGGNKRCSNQRLLRNGFHLQYPDFRAGYRDILGLGQSE